MIYQEIDVKNQDSLEDVKLQLYILDYAPNMPVSESRPIVLICPGGGYYLVSNREAEPIAMKYLSAGIHAAVLYYSVAPATFPTALLETAKAIRYLRENAAKLHIDPNKIMIEGFSAGGHLAASYCEFWKKDFLMKKLREKEKDIPVEIYRPNGLLLGYPVITSGQYAHKESFENLIGEKEGVNENSDRLWSLVSLENQVNEDVPSTFVWTTQNDEVVPVENSLLFVNALQKQGINYELHIYPKGFHGLSLANEVTACLGNSGYQPECEEWIDLSIRWIKD